MIIDINAWIGAWPTLPVAGDPAEVAEKLAAWGVTRAYVSPLEAAWAINPHTTNDAVYGAAEVHELLSPTPVIDPTVATWQDELARAASHHDVVMIRLLPTYHAYDLNENMQADALVAAAQGAGLAVMVQTKIDDPRRHHPLAMVPTLPVDAVISLARRHPQARVIIGGADVYSVLGSAAAFGELEHLYADVSQVDSFDGVLDLVRAELTPRLLFGSHVPVFGIAAAMSRVALDLADADAAAVFRGNAVRALELDSDHAGQ